jgi:hypothetical protein
MSDRPSTLLERFHAKVLRRSASECWPWTAGVSRSGRREVDYGAIRYGGKTRRILRANRLALMLHTAPIDVPRDDTESFDDWFRRVERCYRGLEAAHECDNSMCCNPAHLSWQTHTDNVREQRKRKVAA